MLNYTLKERDLLKNDLRIINPRYRQIAIDIASRIVDKEYSVGEKVYSRSLIAAQYSVSPETARRAIAVLSDMGIVEAIKGSGVLIKSYENALEFVKLNQDVNTIEKLSRDTIDQVNALVRESNELKDKVERLVDRATLLRGSAPFVPYEFRVTDNLPSLGKSISELNFWQNTSATVVAIQRGEFLIMSPGPYETFKVDDIIYFVGNNNCFSRVVEFMEKADITKI